jgi:hypothetical protein
MEDRIKQSTEATIIEVNHKERGGVEGKGEQQKQPSNS